MRSFINRFDLVVLFLFFMGFGALSFGSESRLDPALGFVVSPVGKEVVSRSFVVLIDPGPSLVSASLQLEDESNTIVREFSLSAQTNFSAGVSLEGLENGSYSLIVSLCDGSHCEEVVRPLRVENPPLEADATPNEGILPLPINQEIEKETRAPLVEEKEEIPPQDETTPRIEKRPGKEEIIPIPLPQPAPITLFPSNIFGLTLLREPGGDTVARSSGDPIQILPGRYDADIAFSDFFISSIRWVNLQLVNDGQLVNVDLQTKVSPFSHRDVWFEPVSSLVVSYGFDFDSAELRLPTPKGERINLFFCSLFSFSDHSCEVQWLPVPREKDSFVWSMRSKGGIFSFVRRLKEPPIAPPKREIIFSNLKGEFYVVSLPDETDTEKKGPFENTPVSLAQGRYDVLFHFFESPFSFIRLRDANIDHSGTVLKLEGFPSALKDANEAEEWWVYSDYFFEDGSFRVSKRFDSVWQACLSLDEGSKSCRKWEWQKKSEIKPGWNAFLFYRKTPPDLNEVFSPFAEYDLNLVQAIQWLHRLHSNKRYFLGVDAQESYDALRTLFSEIQMNLECDPTSSPIVSRVDRVSDSEEISPEIGSWADSASDSLDEKSKKSDISPDSRVPGPPFGLPSDYFSPGNPLFFTNGWEELFPSSPEWRQRENNVSCDGVTLSNQFSFGGAPPDTEKEVFLGASRSRVKQRFVLSNDTNQIQTRVLSTRFVSPFSVVISDTNTFYPSSIYQLVPARKVTVTVFSSEDGTMVPLTYTYALDTTLRFAGDNLSSAGFYSMEDMLQSGFSPRTVVHRLRNQTIVETLLEITLLPSQSVLVDPVFDLGSSSNYSAAWNGGSASDFLGNINNSSAPNTRVAGTSVQLVNVDNNAYSNDLLIAAPYADVNSKTDAGAVYLIRDIDTKSGTLDLANTDNFAIRWNGASASDNLGYGNLQSAGVQLVNADNNLGSNDLLITASLADTTAASNAGSVYLIKDINTFVGVRDLINTPFFSVRWDGNSASDKLGSSNSDNVNFGGGGEGVQLVNVDGNAYSNDLLITASLADGVGRSNNGIVYLVRDIDKLSGVYLFNTTSNFSASWVGSRASDFLGATINSGLGVQFVNVDGNTHSNDLLITASGGDCGLTNNGCVYLFKDINTLFGEFDLNNSSNYAVRWAGARGADALGATIGTGGAVFSGGLGVQLVNTDGNVAVNDLLLCASLADSPITNAGSAYLIKDINVLSGNQDLNDSTKFNVRWSPYTNGDRLCHTNGGSRGMQLVNIDGNSSSNDLLLSSYVLDANSKADAGGVYLIKDINTLSGIFDLSQATSYNAFWSGSQAGDTLSSGVSTGASVQLVNVDNNAYANDLLLNAPLADTVAANTGAVYLIRDINLLSGTYDLNNADFFTVRWAPASANDNLTDNNMSGSSVQLVNVDNNAYSNDLLIAAPYADVNSKTDAGAVWLIRDIDKLSPGVKSLDNSANYAVLWNGSRASDFLGSAQSSGSSVQLINIDNNAYSNDLLITDINSDNPYTDAGSVYVIRAIDSYVGARDLNNADFFSIRYSGGSAGDQLGETLYSSSGAQLVNVDNNAYSNDLILTASLADINSKTNAGAVYLLRDAVTANASDYSFVLSLPTACTDGKGAIVNCVDPCTCIRGWIETTDVNGNADQNQVAPDGQTATVPFFVYDNQSTTSSDLNILLDLNASLPASLVLKASQSASGYQGQCSGNPNSGCIVVSTTATSVGKATYTAGAQDLNIWFWGDFISVSPGDTDRNVDSNSRSPY